MSATFGRADTSVQSLFYADAHPLSLMLGWNSGEIELEESFNSKKGRNAGKQTKYGRRPQINTLVRELIKI